jgi:DNA-binding MarR family transcriptional regulator
MAPPIPLPLPPESDRPDTVELADAVQRASKRIRRETFHRLAPFGITPSQGRALDTLGRAADHHGREMRLNELADRLRIAPRSATTVVDALETAGLVTRVPDPADRRATLLRLTPAGREALARIAEVRAEVAEEYFGPVPEEDRTVALRVVQAVATGEGRVRHGCGTDSGGSHGAECEPATAETPTAHTRP